jgi:hypothetical protein
VPVDVGDQPAAAREQQLPRTFDLLGEQVRVRSADFHPPVEHRELGRCSEDGGEPHEVTVSEAALLLRTDEEHSSVSIEVSLVHEVAHDRLGGLPEGAEPIPPFLPELVTDLVFLEAEGDELLCHDVAWLRGCADRLHPAARPLQQ